MLDNINTVYSIEVYLKINYVFTEALLTVDLVVPFPFNHMHPKGYEEMNRGNGYIWLDESRERDSTFTLQNQVAALQQE